MTDPFEGLPPFDPGKFDPLHSPPPVVIEKVLAAVNDARSGLNEEQRNQFDEILNILTSMGFGAMMMMDGGGDPTMNVGEIMGLSDQAVVAFIQFASDLATAGIDSIIPKDHAAYDKVAGGQLQVLVGLIVGYKLRQEQEGRRR